MLRKFVFIIMFVLPLCISLSAFNNQPVKSGTTTWTVDDDGSADFHTIQDAINSPQVMHGDTIYVYSGTYDENVVVNKTVSLIGENMKTTLIDGKGTDAVISVVANNVVIDGFNIRNGGGFGIGGIHVNKFNHTVIRNNYISLNIWSGVSLIESFNNTLMGNHIIDNSLGVELYFSYNNTIIENNLVQNGIGVDIPPGDGVRLYESFNNTIFRNKIADNTLWGIELLRSSNNTISKNVVTNNKDGIRFLCSDNNKLIENNITNNRRGVFVYRSSYNKLSNNHISGNTYNFGVSGQFLNEFIQDIDTSNTVDSKPIYYWINQQNKTVPADAGYVALVNSNNITVKKLNLKNNGQGLLLAYTENTLITGNYITENQEGIGLTVSCRNVIFGNNITENDGGIELFLQSNNNSIYGNNILSNRYGVYSFDFSENNYIYHNNFINNTSHAYVVHSSNSWDDGYPSGGNYWSNYTSIDADENGISDVPYTIEAENIDRYPLMAPINIFDAGIWNETAYNVEIVSNSTILDFQLNVDQKTVSFNVSGLEFTTGFCRVSVPNIIIQNMWHGNYTVLLNGNTVAFRNWTDNKNTYIYINYTHSQHQVVIIPEFPSLKILPPFMVFTTFALFFVKKKFSRK